MMSTVSVLAESLYTLVYREKIVTSISKERYGKDPLVRVIPNSNSRTIHLQENVGTMADSVTSNMVNTVFMLPLKGSTLKRKSESCKVSLVFGANV